MPELPISQPLAAPLGQRSRSIWDEDGPNFEDDPFRDFPGEPHFEEGPLTDAQVKALLGSKPGVNAPPASDAGERLSPTTPSSAGLPSRIRIRPTTTQPGTPPRLVSNSEAETAAPGGATAVKLHS